MTSSAQGKVSQEELTCGRKKVNEALLSLAREVAAKHGLDPQLVCSVVEQESAWDTFAVRYEPAFFAKYVAPLYTNNKVSVTEAYARSVSWGLMQVMGEVARERGFAGNFLSSLCDPATGLEYGCRHLASRLAIAKGDVTKALLLWNGGGNPNYASEVLARMGHYA
jgi:soluble lytic murein transglycosylase-like protein